MLPPARSLSVWDRTTNRLLIAQATPFVKGGRGAHCNGDKALVDRRGTASAPTSTIALAAAPERPIPVVDSVARGAARAHKAKGCPYRDLKSDLTPR